MKINLYNYKAHVLRVLDGDTIEVTIDVGFNISINQIVRLSGIDSPEIHSLNEKEKQAGLFVKDYVSELLIGEDVFLQTIKYDDKYGRYLANVVLMDGSMLNEHLINIGFVNSYDGGTKAEWTDEVFDRIINTKIP
jgi:micrococcal nuclease